MKKLKLILATKRYVTFFWDTLYKNVQILNLTKISLALSVCSIISFFWENLIKMFDQNAKYQISPKSVWLSPSSQPSKQPTWIAPYHLHLHLHQNLGCTWSFHLHQNLNVRFQIQAGCLNQPTIIISCGRALLQILFTWEISSCGNVGSTSGNLSNKENWNREQAAKIQIVRLFIKTRVKIWAVEVCKV